MKNRKRTEKMSWWLLSLPSNCYTESCDDSNKVSCASFFFLPHWDKLSLRRQSAAFIYLLSMTERTPVYWRIIALPTRGKKPEKSWTRQRTKWRLSFSITTRHPGQFSRLPWKTAGTEGSPLNGGGLRQTLANADWLVPAEVSLLRLRPDISLRPEKWILLSGWCSKPNTFLLAQLN